MSAEDPSPLPACGERPPEPPKRRRAGEGLGDEARALVRTHQAPHPHPLPAGGEKEGAGDAARPWASTTLHASCVALGEGGVLIRGPSGSGKSRLAALLVREAQARGRFAAWVGDDRVIVRSAGGRLVARPHPAIAGRCEARGLGIVSVPSERATVLSLVVDLQEEVERLPQASELVARVGGVALPRMPLVAQRAGLYEAALVLDQMRTQQDGDERPTAILSGRCGRYLTEAR